MSPIAKKTIMLVALFTLSGALASTMFNPGSARGANNRSSDALSLAGKAVEEKLKPVDNMHHFMEYIYEPVFNDLKALVEKEPADKKGWSAIKSKSLILAETSILLHDRVPAVNLLEDKDAPDAKEWTDATSITYKGASALYQSARKKDFDGVKKHFGEMLNGCKKCHEAYR